MIVARHLAKPSVPHPGRRQFLLAGAAVLGGLAVGFEALPVAAQAVAGPSLNPFDVYVRIGSDSSVTVLSAHMDKGQGIYTGIATLVAEELDADWAQMRVEGACSNPVAYGNLVFGGAFQITGNTTGLVSSWDRYRQAGAAARAMLIAAAAAKWKVDPASIRIESGVLKSGARSARFGDLAELAAQLPVPASVALKTPQNWRHIGKSDCQRVDTQSKVNGNPIYTIDVDLPGMLTAVLIRPTRFGARVVSLDASEALKSKGVTDVVSIGHAVAVVGTSTWAAIKARDLVKITWDDSNAEKRSSGEMFAEWRALAAAKPQAIAVDRGDVGTALGRAARVIETTYEFPYLAHAAMEPMNCVVARRDDGTIEAWSAFQGPDIDQQAMAATAGVPPDKIKMHVLLAGGSFGRRTNLVADYPVETVAVAKAIGWKAPVKLQFTREADMLGGHYRPMLVHRVRVGLDAAGDIIAWDHHIVGQPLVVGSIFDAALVKNGVDRTSVEGAEDTPYRLPAMRLGVSYPKSPITVLWWRSVGHTHTAYAIETMLDQIAAETKQDPIALRRKLLRDQPRHLGVLDLAIEKADWSKPAAAGVYRGVAVHESFRTCVAWAAEVTRSANGKFSVKRLVGAVDCGITVNPDQVKAQMEGGAVYALSAILAGEITLEKGEIQQTNFDAYEPVRIDATPTIEVHIVASTEPPTGIGEPSVPPLGPAVANAIASATAQPICILPIRKSVKI